MRYAILGAAGQLGHDLASRLEGEVTPFTHAQADLTRRDSLRAALGELRPDVVVNCAAYNLVDRAETEPETAFAVNAWGVRNLATVCRDLDCVLVHFSTDYVFGLDTTRTTPYAENDPPGPVSVYGMSKLTGEYLVRTLCPQHYVVRTCGLYGVWGVGGKGGNFVETMLRVQAQGKPLRVVADQVLAPSYTVDVAKAVAALVQTDCFGLYHLTNAGACSWHEFAQTLFQLAGIETTVAAITSQEFGAPARRPSYSVLENQAYRSLGLPPLRPWREALKSYLDERRRQ